MLDEKKVPHLHNVIPGSQHDFKAWESDAHLEHDRPLTAEDLLPYRDAQPPKDQQEAMQRRKVMRKARSKKTT